MSEKENSQENSQFSPEDRRRRAALRGLVEQMMVELRAAARKDEWTAAERERAEADLDRIMQQVRRETFRSLKGR